MILDIETTGLSSAYAQVILVGFIYYADSEWHITQIFCDHRSEEKTLLLELITFIQQKHLLITYNGHAFDLPFLNKRLNHHGINFQFSLVQHFDLYRVVRASKKALNLQNYKLKTIEEYLNIYRDDQISGKESVELYNDYESTPTVSLRDKILLHNFDDIKFMIPTMQILIDIPNEIIDRFYPFSFTVYKHQWFLTHYLMEKDYLTLHFFTKNHNRSIADYRDSFSLSFSDQTLILKIPIFQINKRSFIDTDLLPFDMIAFNQLTLEAQLSLEILSKPITVKKILQILEKHYIM